MGTNDNERHMRNRHVSQMKPWDMCFLVLHDDDNVTGLEVIASLYLILPWLSKESATSKMYTTHYYGSSVLTIDKFENLLHFKTKLSQMKLTVSIKTVPGGYCPN
jgi:hypothetical protein